MKNIILCLLIVTGALTACSQGHSYYVANNGDDNNNGLTVNSPFKTINKVNNLQLQPGDIVYFKKGDIFSGQLNIKQSGSSEKPIVIDGYGSGNKPVIDGSTQLTNWANKGGNIWQASCPQCGNLVTGVYLDSAPLPLGRYPKLNSANRGYLTVSSHVGIAKLTSKESINKNWVGGEIVYRPQEWIFDKRKIIGQSGNSFILDSTKYPGTNYEIQNNWGYFIQNHPSTLTENGEWCYDKTNKVILIYFDQGDPNSKRIEVTTYSKAINIDGASGIIIQNIQISQALNYNLYANNSSNLTIKNVDITNAGENGLEIGGSGSNVTIENSLIHHINNNAIQVHGISNFTFKSNLVEDVAAIPGLGKNGDGQYYAFLYVSNIGQAVIANNRFNNLGYVGVGFASSNITIQYNEISNYDLIETDGGGIYTAKGFGNSPERVNQRVLNNIILHAVGPKEGTPQQSVKYYNATGIYMDDCSQNVEVMNNTVANCSGPGIYLHGASNINVTGNTFFNNGVQFTILDSHCGVAGSNNVNNNIFFTKGPNQVFGRYEERFGIQNENLSTFGSIDNNFYYSAFDIPGGIDINLSNTGVKGSFSLNDWKNKFGKDNSSRNNSLHLNRNLNPDQAIRFEYNPTNENKVINLNGEYEDVNNKSYSGTVTIPPYASIILIRKN